MSPMIVSPVMPSTVPYGQTPLMAPQGAISPYSQAPSMAPQGTVWPYSQAPLMTPQGAIAPYGQGPPLAPQSITAQNSLTNPLSQAPLGPGTTSTLTPKCSKKIVVAAKTDCDTIPPN